MFNLGDRVKHIDTGNIGIVVGYGKRIVNNKCLAILKVKLVDSTARKKATIKDLDSKWFPCPENYKTSHSNTPTKHLIVKPAKRFTLSRSAQDYSSRQIFIPSTY